MADCECHPSCLFFNDKMSDRQGMAQIYKARYCQGDNGRCARYRVFQAVGRNILLPDLYPNQRDRVPKLIAAR